MKKNDTGYKNIFLKKIFFCIFLLTKDIGGGGRIIRVFIQEDFS